MNVINLKKERHVANTSGKIAEHLSESYAPISTELLLKPFFDKGWQIVESRYNKKKSKDWLSLEHPNYKISSGDSLRLEVTNSTDGSTALNIMGGIGRLVCANGLVIGSDFETFRFVHRGTSIYEKLDDAYEKIVAKLESIQEKFDKLNNISPLHSQLNEVLGNIYKKLIESDGEKRTVKLLKISDETVDNTLIVHRDADKGLDAYTRLNVVQENIVRNGIFKALIEVTDKATGEKVTRTITKKPSEGKMSSLKINDVITTEFLKLVA